MTPQPPNDRQATFGEFRQVAVLKTEKQVVGQTEAGASG
jgi:hypothetical protein